MTRILAALWVLSGMAAIEQQCGVQLWVWGRAWRSRRASLDMGREPAGLLTAPADEA